MEFVLAICFVVPLSALWMQSTEGDDDDDRFDFL